MKLLPWFSEHGKVVQAICFEPTTNERLLVLCDDNTLHVIPSLAIVQEEAQQADSKTTTTTTPVSHSTTITSYIIPFVGPHECPNPRTCPNNFYRPPNLDLEQSLKTTIAAADPKQPPTLDELYSKQSVDRLLSARDGSSTYCNDEGSSSAAAVEESGDQQSQRQRGQNDTVCPYPTAVVWWQTKRRQDRAIVGYSDGSVCFLCKIVESLIIVCEMIYVSLFQPSHQTVPLSPTPLCQMPCRASTFAGIPRGTRSLCW